MARKQTLRAGKACVMADRAARKFCLSLARARKGAMCRNIRVLYNFQPPTTPDEIRAAALQYVRKVSGVVKPSAADVAVVEKAIAEITASTTTLLHDLTARAPVRTREGERQKGKLRWADRQARIARATSA